MAEERDIILRLRLNQSIRSIRQETRRHRRDIRALRDLALDRGWLDIKNPAPTETEVAIALGIGSTQKEHPLDVYAGEIKRWLADEKSIVVIHELIRQQYECSESQVRRYIRNRFPATPRMAMHRPTTPGEFMDVDFGYMGMAFDPDKKRIRKTYIFSARLRHSRKAYREIVFSQQQDVFFNCHIHAFEHFGGVVLKVAVDNLKAAVIKACYNEPLLNRAYRSLAEHYGFLISPCLPYRPQHKGGVENDIKYVKNNFWPFFKEQQRILGRDIPDAGDLKTALVRWDEEVAGVRKIGGVGRTPTDLFENEEQSCLQPLPAERWDRPVYKQCKVAANWHIQFERAFYSVPYAHIGRRVLVCGTSKIVRISGDSGEITSHLRAERDWQYRSKSEHAPPHKEQYLQLTRQGVEWRAVQLGAGVLGVVRKIFNDRAMDGLRPARGVLRLADKYNPARLNRACLRALEFDTPSYKSVKNILTKNLDQLAAENQAIGAEGQRHFRFAREHGYFDVSDFQINNKEKANG
ncbi:MAG: IS21 family transposase [Leptospiraceae bacterium]|nr:IS21 family transposase [Leptospiraceae bacterium]MCB1316245.1 IS21 family transposase [Leptospiraceae bacterium]